jgi:redox-regulated HSP33 family molecular chaperone
MLQGEEAAGFTVDQLPQEWRANSGPQALEPLTQLLQALPQVRQQLSRDQELEDIVAALAAATGMDRARTYGAVGVVDYLRGHMYT